MTLRDFLLAWHLATHQNPRLAVSLQQALFKKACLLYTSPSPRDRG